MINLKRNIKFILLFNFIILFFIVFPNKASANFQSGIFTCKINNNSITIIDCSNEEEINIPSAIEGYPVTELGESAFWHSKNSVLKKVTIPSSVTKIGDSCFSMCSELTSIELPNSITSIGNGAFYGCKKLTNLRIPDKITTISEGMFSGSGITSIIIPYTITSIGKTAFLNCENLKEIEIPNGITTIYERTFMGCSSLQNVRLPDSLIKIDSQAFSECTSLEKIRLPSKVTGIGASAFSKCTNLTEINIPNKVTTIGSLAFWYCEKLENIVIPDSVIKIENNIFGYCENLKNVTLSKSLTEIPEYAFNCCRNLSSIKIPNGIISIRNYAFYLCESLKEINIPNTVTTIENSAFTVCTSLKEIIIPESVTSIGTYAFSWENILLYIKKGSYIEQFAIEQNEYYNSIYNHDKIKYEYIDDIEPITKTTGDFKSEKKLFQGRFGFYYDDEYFLPSSSEYNHNLATMSLCLSFSAFNATGEYKSEQKDVEDNNVKQLLAKCGFKKYKQHNYDIEPTSSTIGCALASKKIDDTTIIAIAIRGGGYGKEWASNLTVGKNGDHAGFESAANKISMYLQDYFIDLNISSMKDVKIWITGYSRAGAVANILAAKLDRSETLDKDNIFAYCFATPAGASLENNPHDNKYNNIFSIISFHDVVPMVAPDFWNFDRYGITKVFAVKDFSKKDATYEKNMTKYLKNMGYPEYEIDNFREYFFYNNTKENSIGVISLKANMGTFYRKVFNTLKGWDKINSRQSFVDNGTQTMIQQMITGNEYDKGLLIDLGIELLTIAAIQPNMANTLYQNKDRLVTVHAEQAYYLAWMQSMDSNYVKGAIPYFSNFDYRVATYNCPVDIYVYDSNNKLLSSIINEEPKKITEDAPLVTIDENGQKLVYLPKDEKYKIKTVARENCNVTYTVNEYSGINSKATRIVNYNEIAMKKSEEFISMANAYSTEEQEKENESGTSVSYTVEKNNKKINASLDISGNQIAKYTYTVSIKNDTSKGTITGGGVYTIGEFCQVIAEEKNGYQFIGWYNGNVKVSGDVAYRFAVKNNITLEAKYIPGVKTISLSKTSFKYNKKIQKPTVTIKDCEGKKLKEGTDYTIKYSNKKSKKVGEYTVTITFKGIYEGSKKLTYQIKPNGVSLKKLTKGKKQFKATWTKNTTETTGYQIQYSTKKDFSSGSKSTTINKNKTTGATVKKLKNKKKYYVRIRTYKTVKVNGKSKKIYSSWSKVLNVKTK